MSLRFSPVPSGQAEVHDVSFEFSRDYHGLAEDGGSDAAFSVLTRKRGTIRLFGGWPDEVRIIPRTESARRAGSDVAMVETRTETLPEAEVLERIRADMRVFSSEGEHRFASGNRARFARKFGGKFVHFVSKWDCPTTART